MKKTPKVRISLDCSAEERKLIKVLASLADMTISDYLLSLAKSKIERIDSLRSISQNEKNSKGKSDNSWNSFNTFLEGIA